MALNIYIYILQTGKLLQILAVMARFKILTQLGKQVWSEMLSFLSILVVPFPFHKCSVKFILRYKILIFISLAFHLYRFPHHVVSSNTIKRR